MEKCDDGYPDSSRINLLIIDPQVDFHEGGSLAVAGATKDSERIIEFINKFNSLKTDSCYTVLNRVFVSLDTHTQTHIGHSGFWESKIDRTNPGPFTVFSVENNTVMGNGVEYIPTRYPGEENKDYKQRVEIVKNYIMEVPKYGKGPALIWPTHCIEGTNGHQVYPALKTALDNLGDKVEYHIKGQNEWAEMYSIFEAEIPVEGMKTVVQFKAEPIVEEMKTVVQFKAEPPVEEMKEVYQEIGLIDKRSVNKYYRGTQSNFKTSSKINVPNSDEADGVYLQTTFNEDLYKSLTKDNIPIYICGEALSHCVNWSLRDLVEKLVKDKKYPYVLNGKVQPNMVVLLIDCSSPVGGFEQKVVGLLEFCKEKNVTVMNSIDRINSDQALTIDELIKKYSSSRGGTKKKRRARGGAYKPRTKKANLRKRKTNKRRNKKRRHTKK